VYVDDSVLQRESQNLIYKFVFNNLYILQESTVTIRYHDTF